MISQPSNAEAWNDYWRGQQGGCLPTTSSSVDTSFREAWRRAATLLSPDARVLDLATGNGAVLRWLRETRDDLVLVGVDLADTLPPPPPGTVTHGGVAMESLPFADGAFDAVVSQFGFEYGDLHLAAGEAARVLRGGAQLSLVTHNAAGPIVAHNKRRALGLVWALDEEQLIALARRTGPADLAAVASGPDRAIERFGAGSAAWQLAEAIARTVTQRSAASDPRATAMLGQLERMARGEFQRIAALERASEAMAVEGQLETVLAAHRFALVEHVPVIHAADGLTLADHWSFRRR